MSEAERARQYLKGLQLLEEAFTTLREPLEIDDNFPGIYRPEFAIAFFIREASERLQILIKECEKPK